MKKVYKVAIVGTGAAGLLALLSLSFSLSSASAFANHIAPNEILLIDPHHDGGDLQRKWGEVLSNTTWGQMLEIVEKKGFSRQSLPEPWKSLDPLSPTFLKQYIHLLQFCTKQSRETCELLFGRCERLEQESAETSVKVTGTDSQGQPFTINALHVLMTIGSEPRQDTYPLPTIPLEVALDKSRLSSYLDPNSKVMMIGTAHSGTLILRNLHELGAEVGAFYRGPKPFTFARDGHYDGIKQESEKIADTILEDGYAPRLSLVPLTNTAQLIRWSRKADWIIYATGFERRRFSSSLAYDGQTGKIEGFHHVWGFGIGFPNLAADGLHWDVSLPAFATHIDTQLPKILKSFYA